MSNPFTTSPAYVPSPKPAALQKLKSGFTARTPRRVARILLLATQDWMNIWFNKDGLTPQEACNAYGNDALYMLQIGQATSTWYATICPGKAPVLVPLPGCTVQVNLQQDGVTPDGTITILGWNNSMTTVPAWASDALGDPNGASPI